MIAEHRAAQAAVTLCVLSYVIGCGAGPPASWPATSFASSQPEPIQVGAAAVAITPDLGRAVYLAGGMPYRPALRVHDDLWARAVVLDDGQYRVAMVALDLIGLYYDEVVRIREATAGTGVDYVLVACTHTHNGPDVLGVWSPGADNRSWRDRAVDGACEAVREAFLARRPARIRIAGGNSGDVPLTRDTRRPEVIDDTLTVWQATDAGTGAAILTSVHYASHPILVPSFNFDVSSDWVHTLRCAVESGMAGDAGPVLGQGGLCVFFNGALGGRIVPANAEPVTIDPEPDPAYARAHGYGYRLARRVQELLEEAEWLDERVSLGVRAEPIRVAMENALLGGGAGLGLIPRGLTQRQVNSEVAIVQLGPVEFFAVPGMIFPELVRGGVGPLDGSDFPEAPVEYPPLAALARGRYFVTVGIANDMLGYLIPLSQWDAAAPYTTEDGRPPYGEAVSPGPNAATTIIDAFRAIRRE